MGAYATPANIIGPRPVLRLRSPLGRGRRRWLVPGVGLCVPWSRIRLDGSYAPVGAAIIDTKGANPPQPLGVIWPCLRLGLGSAQRPPCGGRPATVFGGLPSPARL